MGPVSVVLLEIITVPLLNSGMSVMLSGGSSRGVRFVVLLIQNVNANQFVSQGRILTVAYGTMYDLYTKGVKGVVGVSNHHFSTFKKDPLDDTELLKKIWKVLDESEVLVAHTTAAGRRRQAARHRSRLVGGANRGRL